MALIGPRPSLLLSLALLAASLALASGFPCLLKRHVFRRNHVDFPQTQAPNANTYCNERMKAVKLCKETAHTFIHAPVRIIDSVCKKGTLVQPDLVKSQDSFPVTTCVYLPASGSYIGKSYSRQIVLRCSYGHATYYQE
ncbi:ribonuclease-like [Pelodiscus sinensis]|uniref:ribonuclease-like n=1 Tax=Pelodiscus sinensis TaxID=13735 RepID=UPI003F6B283A